MPLIQDFKYKPFLYKLFYRSSREYRDPLTSISVCRSSSCKCVSAGARTWSVCVCVCVCPRLRPPVPDTLTHTLMLLQLFTEVLLLFHPFRQFMFYSTHFWCCLLYFLILFMQSK